MARQKLGPRSNDGSSARIKVVTSAGQPNPKRLVRPFGRKTVFHRMVKMGTVRTLIKRNPNDGMSMPDARSITTAHGVTTVGGGGYKGAVRVSKQQKLTTGPAKGTRVVKTPRPAPGGVRNPYGRIT